MSFYKVPRYIFNPIAVEKVCDGTVLLPFDFNGELQKELETYGLHDTIRPDGEEDIQNPEWWLSYKGKVDWIVAITQGLGNITNWLLDYGLEITNEGMCVLDRITFIEPTKKREKFLEDSSLTNLKILSPRPCFRADEKQLKDSVTSAWFIFKKPGAAKINTVIDFEVGWDRPKNLKK